MNIREKASKKENKGRKKEMKRAKEGERECRSLAGHRKGGESREKKQERTKQKRSSGSKKHSSLCVATLSKHRERITMLFSSLYQLLLLCFFQILSTGHVFTSSIPEISNNYILS